LGHAADLDDRHHDAQLGGREIKSARDRFQWMWQFERGLAHEYRGHGGVVEASLAPRARGQWQHVRDPALSIACSDWHRNPLGAGRGIAGTRDCNHITQYTI